MTDQSFEAEPGARVVLDSSGFLAKENLGKTDNNYVREATTITWDDIGGLWDAKEQLQEAIELPMSHPEIFEKYGQEPIKGVLLYGPPGCGKTLLGKATATSIARNFGAQSSTGFIYIKGPEVLSKWLGESEAKIRQLFAMARDHRDDTGYPAVIFIDEADALLGRRGRGIGGSSISDTVVPTFLAEMDGLDDTGAVVLLATNRPDTLDPAVIRPGRIDRKIKISRPDRETAADILRIHLRSKPVTNTLDAVIQYVMEAVFDDNNRVQGQPLSSVLNGAILENIVSRATSFAIKDDISRGSFGGITHQHFMDAIQLVSLQDEDVDISNF
jgi:proteasome-associated ATPase